MIKVLESSYLKDEFINKNLISNINLTDNISFSKDNIYYFGNYNEDNLELIRKKLLKNKKRIINSIEKGIKFIICGNSFELFNNQFNSKSLNIYTCYDSISFKKKFSKLKIKDKKNNYKIIKVNNLSKVISNANFRYKNLLCIKDEKNIDKIIKKLTAKKGN